MQMQLYFLLNGKMIKNILLINMDHGNFGVLRDGLLQKKKLE